MSHPNLNISRDKSIDQMREGYDQIKSSDIFIGSKKTTPAKTDTLGGRNNSENENILSRSFVYKNKSKTNTPVKTPTSSSVLDHSAKLLN